MAIRFDIDKYRDIRNTYIRYLKGDVVPNIQQTQLFEKYKPYWQNDDEVKSAETEYRKKREQCCVGGWKLVKDRKNESDAKNKNVELVSKVKHKEHKQKVAKVDKSAKENDVCNTRLFTIANVLHVETTSDGGFVDIEKIISLIRVSKDFHILNTINLELQKICSIGCISAKTYHHICKYIREQCDAIKFEEIINNTKSSRCKMISENNKEGNIKHSSIRAFSGGIPGLGKRH